MKQAWNRLGSPDAISWMLLLLVSIQQVFGSLAGPFVDISGRVFEFVALRVVALGTMFVVLGLGRLALQHLTIRRPLPWLTIAIFAATTVVGTTVFNGLLIWGGFTTEWNVGRRLLVAIPGIFTILILVALLVTYARDAENRNRRLSDTVAALSATREESTSRIEQRKRVLVDDIRSKLERQLDTLQSGHEHPSSRRLTALVDDVVRPMSYELSTNVKNYQPNRVETIDAGVSWGKVLITAMRGNPAHPFATSIWIGLLLGAFLSTGTGLRGLAGAGALSVITLVVLYITRLGWPNLPEKLSVGARTALFGLVVLSIGTSTAVVMTAVTGYSFTTAHTFTGWITLNFFMTWTVTLFYAVSQNLRQTNSQLTIAAEELRREIIKLNTEFRMLQKGISRILHGPIQEAISAAIHRLQTAQDDESESVIVTEMRQRINRALYTDPTTLETDVDARLNDLVELWDEVCVIEASISDDARSIFRRDPLTAAAVIELIREGCNNAMRHGEADHITVSIDTGSRSNTIEIVMTNDGAPLPREQHSGLGSQIFDDSCLSWSMRNVNAKVVVTAVLPVSLTVTN